MSKWEKVNLVDVCDFQGGSQPPKEQWIDEAEDGYIRMLQIRDFTQNRDGKEEYIKISKNIKTCDDSDILIARYGASVGKILSGLSGAYNVAIMKTIPDTKKLNKKYLRVFLLSNIFQNYIANVGSRAAQAGFNKLDLENLSIPLPPFEIQRQIAKTLDTATELLAMRKQQLAELDNLIKSTFYDMFGDPVTNEKGWGVEKLMDITTKIGSGATPRGGKESYQDEGISLIRSLNVHNGVFKYNQLAHIDDKQAKQLDNVTVKENDVLINITGASVARSCIVPNDVLPARVNQHVSIVRVKEEKATSVYINNVFTNSSFQTQLLSIGGAGGATREAITKQQLQELVIPLPPISLQTQFAEIVTKIEEQKALVQKAIDETQYLFDSLMSEYFE